MGSITICAATMQDDIIAVATRGWARASFCPTRGKSAALAKWNRKAQRQKVASGLDLEQFERRVGPVRRPRLAQRGSRAT